MESQKVAEPARSYRARAVGDMLPEVGRTAFRRFGFIQSSIVSRWGEIVGARYAGVTAPESIRFPPGRRSGGVLTLVVEGAHAPLIQHVAPAIIDRINRFFGYGAVDRVQVRQGFVEVVRARPRPAAPPAEPLSAELGDSLREVGDLELRACLEALARGLAASEGTDREAVASIPVLGKLKG